MTDAPQWITRATRPILASEPASFRSPTSTRTLASSSDPPNAAKTSAILASAASWVSPRTRTETGSPRRTSRHRHWEPTIPVAPVSSVSAAATRRSVRFGSKSGTSSVSRGVENGSPSIKLLGGEQTPRITPEDAANVTPPGESEPVLTVKGPSESPAVLTAVSRSFGRAEQETRKSVRQTLRRPRSSATFPPRGEGGGESSKNG